MKRGGYLRRSSPMKRGGRVNPVNLERQAKRAEVNWPQRDRCRQLACAACGRDAPSDPAHILTRASLAGAPPSKVDRANVVPLCRTCHTIQGTMPISQFDLDHMHGLTMQGVADGVAAQLEAEGVTWE